jgi:glycosyltransferase involved in cell wall biosynthesis
MSASTEPGVSEGSGEERALGPRVSEGCGEERALGPDWRAQAARVQQSALPPGRVIVSCPVPFGVGGLGRHLQEVVEALDHGGQPNEYVCGPARAPVPAASRRTSRLPPLLSLVAPATRLSPSWRHWRTSIEFDSFAARRLPAGEHLIGFNGTSVAQFRAARGMGFQSVSLMSANSHMRRVIRQHERAYRQYPLERPWATRLMKRNLLEYEQADRIYVASRYTWESFVEEGFSEQLLSLFPLMPDPRYQPAAAPTRASTFDVVYVGSLTVNKGVPLLLDAFGRLPHDDLRLVLVGGWKTRGMRRFVQGVCARDPRIVVRPGDPLPHLHSARLFVHPSYEDGFAYAPAEALACGVPVLVSEDTGMKDLIDPGVTGQVLPTGDAGALTDALQAAYRGEALGR